LIEILLRKPTTKIHAFCRNKAKLIRLLPEVKTSEQVEIFEGSIHDISLITSCIRDCHAIFLCVSTNDNVPGGRMAEDTAIGVISGLQRLRTEDKFEGAFRAPKLVLLSSNTLDDQLSQKVPPLVREIILRSASHVYKDLRETEKYLRDQQDWVSTIFIKPGGLAVDVQRGHELSLTEERSPLSYLDLAAGMIEAADDPDGKWDMKNVGVLYSGETLQFPRGALMCISMGLVRHYFPFLHPYLPATGPY
jgi:hypothetical protein